LIAHKPILAYDDFFALGSLERVEERLYRDTVAI
jgi:histidine ammonia-lyase